MKTMALLAFSGLFASAGAMTFDELQSAVTAAPAGGTVLVTSDLEYTGTLSVGKKVKLTSGEGGPFEIRRASSCTAPFLDLAAAADDLEIANLAVDGAKDTSSINARMIKVTGGALTLGAGGILRNFYADSGPIYLKGGSITMEEGSELRGFECKTWAIAIDIEGGTFTMNGGLVTGCVGHQTQSTDSDGTIYVYGGTFKFYGGLITGNSSSVANAGIVCYSGTMYLHGNACCTNNVGGYSNDLGFFSAGALVIDGTYTGAMTVRNGGAPIAGNKFGKITISEDARLGACNIRCQEDDTYFLEGETRLAEESCIWRRHPFVVDRLRSRGSLGEAFAVVSEGSVIELQRDEFNFWEKVKLENVSNVTLRSRPGARYVYGPYPDPQYLGMIQVLSAASLRLEDIVIAGFPDVSLQRVLFDVRNGGSLTLGPGTVLRDGLGDVGAVWVRDTGSRLVMESGATITGFRGRWGMAVRVGEDGKSSISEPFPTFVMNGGVISNIVHIGTTDSYQSGWGGAVSLDDGAVFTMTGGLITDNVSEEGACAAGLFAKGASVSAAFSGDATIWGNAGNYPDAMLYKGATASFSGDFRGRIGLCNQGQDRGSSSGVTAADGATGAWNFISKWDGAVDRYVGYLDGSDVKWGEKIGSVGGTAIASMADFAYVMPTTLDLTAGSADRARLPLVCTGVFLSTPAAVTLAYDPETLKASGDLPLDVFAAGEGETFVKGAMTFALPEGAGCWRVRLREAGTVCRLDWQEACPGLAILFK